MTDDLGRRKNEIGRRYTLKAVESMPGLVLVISLERLCSFSGHKNDGPLISGVFSDRRPIE